MPFAPRKQRSKKRSAVKVSKKKPTAVKIAHSMTHLQKLEVKKLIKGPEETKYVAQPLQVPDRSSVLTDFVGFTQGITGVGEIYACLPQLSQGVDSNNRIGNQVTPVKCRIHLAMAHFTSAAIGSNDMTAHVFVLKALGVKSLANFTAIPITSLLEQGDGTDGPFSGATVDVMKKVNTEAFKVIHHKAIRLVKNSGQVQGNPGSTVIDHTHYRELTLNIPVGGKLKYTNSSALYPDNDAPFVVIGWTQNDTTGNSPSTTLQYLQVCARAELWYKDA